MQIKDVIKYAIESTIESLSWVFHPQMAILQRPENHINCQRPKNCWMQVVYPTSRVI